MRPVRTGSTCRHTPMTYGTVHRRTAERHTEKTAICILWSRRYQKAHSVSYRSRRVRLSVRRTPRNRRALMTPIQQDHHPHQLPPMTNLGRRDGATQTPIATAYNAQTGNAQARSLTGNVSPVMQSMQPVPILRLKTERPSGASSAATGSSAPRFRASPLLGEAVS